VAISREDRAAAAGPVFASERNATTDKAIRERAVADVDGAAVVENVPA